MKKGIIFLLSVAAVIGALTLFDYVRSRSISIEVYEITPQTVVADPHEPVLIKLRVTKNGKSVNNHDITCLVMGGGNVKADRVETDANGIAEFTYYPYSFIPKINEESTVKLLFKDVSDSVFIAVQKEKYIGINVKKPENSGSNTTVDDIFNN